MAVESRPLLGAGPTSATEAVESRLQPQEQEQTEDFICATVRACSSFSSSLAECENALGCVLRNPNNGTMDNLCMEFHHPDIPKELWPSCSMLASESDCQEYVNCAWQQPEIVVEATASENEKEDETATNSTQSDNNNNTNTDDDTHQEQEQSTQYSARTTGLVITALTLSMLLAPPLLVYRGKRPTPLRQWGDDVTVCTSGSDEDHDNQDPHNDLDVEVGKEIKEEE